MTQYNFDPAHFLYGTAQIAIGFSNPDHFGDDPVIAAADLALTRLRIGSRGHCYHASLAAT